MPKTQILRLTLETKIRMTVTGAKPGIFETKQVSWNRETLINTSCMTYKRRSLQGKIFVFFLQDTHKTTFQVRI